MVCLWRDTVQKARKRIRLRMIKQIRKLVRIKLNHLTYVFTWVTLRDQCDFPFTVNNKKYGHGKQELKKSISKEGRSMYELILYILIT